MAYDATLEALRSLMPLSDTTIDAILLLSSGDDTDSSTSYEALLKKLTPPEGTRHPVRLFTILYSPRGRDKQHTQRARRSSPRCHGDRRQELRRRGAHDHRHLPRDPELLLTGCHRTAISRHAAARYGRTR